MRLLKRSAVIIGLGAAYFAPYLRSLKTFAISDGFVPSLCAKAKSLSITFDDGPHPIGTPMVLDQLDSLKWKATFFLVGEKVDAHPELVREIVARGHFVGVHGYSHRSMLWLSPRQTWRELSKCKAAIENACGVTPTVFRPPYGELSWWSLAVARKLGLEIKLWTAWGKDWDLGATPQSILKTASRGGLRGGTLLLHDSDSRSSTGNWDATSASLNDLADLFATLNISVEGART